MPVDTTIDRYSGLGFGFKEEDVGTFFGGWVNDRCRDVI
jgi:hypothetical protein